MKRILPFLVLFAIVACDKSPTAPTMASVTVTTTPTQVVAACGAVVQFCAATVALTFQESAGVAVTMTAIRSSFITPAGTTANVADYDAAKITTLAGSTRIPARGLLRVPSQGTQEQIGNLWPSTAGRAGTLAITVQMTDDRGNPIGLSVNIPVS